MNTDGKPDLQTDTFIKKKEKPGKATAETKAIRQLAGATGATGKALRVKAICIHFRMQSQRTRLISQMPTQDSIQIIPHALKFIKK